MRRISLLSWLLALVGLAFVALAVIYLAVTAPNLPSFIPGAISYHVAHARHYKKRGVLAVVLAVVAFVAAYLCKDIGPKLSGPGPQDGASTTAASSSSASSAEPSV